MSLPRSVLVVACVGAVVAVLALAVSACRRSARDRAPRLPDAAAGWSAGSETRSYDTTSIYGYIDGHAEVYLAYGMRSCLSRRYTGPEGEPEIIVDLFEMPSDDDAFGVFSHHREGEVIDVGHGATLAHGWLSAWRDRYYLSATADRATDAARAALLDLARRTLDTVPEGGTPPELIQALPTEGLRRGSVVYLRHPLILQSHLDLGPDNPLQISGSTPAVVADYERGGTKCRALVVSYTDAGTADAAIDGLTNALGADDLSQVAETESRGWTAGQRVGQHLVAAVGADDAETVRTLVEEMTRRVP